MLYRISLVLCVLLMGGGELASPGACAAEVNSGSGRSPTVKTGAPYIDAHAHLDRFDATSVQSMLDVLRTANIRQVILLVPPFTYSDPARYSTETLLAIANRYPERLAVIGGGDSLNAMLIQAQATGTALPAVRRKFAARAQELLREGVVGFGEITTEHFPSAGSADYQYAPPDHPLLLLLADIAARAGVPIVLHTEAVPQDMPLPIELRSPSIPPRLHGNIAALERLLTHNPRASIVWAHAGKDNTGYRTSDLCRRMLRAHPNLYMEIKDDPVDPGKNPVIVGGAIAPEWLQLFREFPDRFILGGDQHYPAVGGPQRWQAMSSLVNQLPPDLRAKFAIDNPTRLYHLKP